MTTYRTAYATQQIESAHDAAKIEFGKNVLLAAPVSNPNMPDFWPYSAEKYEAVGMVAGHRSGPRFWVVRRKAA